MASTVSNGNDRLRKGNKQRRKTNADLKRQNQPRHPPFCSNSQTQGIWNERFNWPDATIYLVLMLRFIFTRRKRTQEHAQAQGRGKKIDSYACACVNPVFQGAIVLQLAVLCLRMRR